MVSGVDTIKKPRGGVRMTYNSKNASGAHAQRASEVQG